MPVNAASLPDTHRAEIRRMLSTTIPDADDSLIEQCIAETVPLYSSGMPAGTFRLRACGQVFVFAQKLLAAQDARYPSLFRAHVRDTLQRCLPCGVSDEMICRCVRELAGRDDSHDPMHTGAIHAFAAEELLTPPDTDHPLRRRLHEAALRYLPKDRAVDRDDLRLVSLAAMYDPSILPTCPHAGFFRLRLGLNGTAPHSCEEIAYMLHIPLTLVHEIEAGALNALSQKLYSRRQTMLDERLMLAASLYIPCDLAADIGTDHAHLPCHLVRQGVCRRMIAADVSEGALNHARENIDRAGLSDRITPVLADGLDAVTEPCGCISIMGMGGENMADILRRGADRLQGATLVLSAHTDQPMVRQALCDIGYRITQEKLCEAAGRFYVFWQAAPGQMELSEEELLYGRMLWDAPASLAKAYADRRVRSISVKLKGLMLAAEPDLAEIARTQAAIDYYRRKLEE